MWWGISGRRNSKVLKQCVFLRRLTGTYNILEKISLGVFLSLCMKTNAQRVCLPENQTITPSKPGLELRSWLPPSFFTFFVTCSFDRCWRILCSVEFLASGKHSRNHLSIAPGFFEIDGGHGLPAKIPFLCQTTWNKHFS